MAKIIENLEIKKIVYGWVGIWELESGKKVLVSGWVLPGSIIDARILKSKKDYIQAQAIKIKKVDEKLLSWEVICPHYWIPKSWEQNLKTGCWGCKWQIMSYQHQLELKYQIVLDSFRSIKDKLSSTTIHFPIWSPKIFWYRNKIEFSFGENIDYDADFVLGFHKQWEFSKLVDIDKCYLTDEKVYEIFSYLKNFLKNSGLPSYKQKLHEWFFRHLVIRQGQNTNQILVNLSVASEKISNSEFEKFLETLKDDNFLTKNINCFVVSKHNWLGDIVTWAEWVEILWWEGYIFERLTINSKDINFRVSPFSFFQTNTLGAQLLLETALGLVSETDWVLLDLYCGTGTIGIAMHKAWVWEKLIWIEIVEAAIKDAQINAKNNWLENFYFNFWKAEKLVFEDENISKELYNIKTIVVDPPRDWLHPNVVWFLNKLKKYYQFKLIYISCNPVTFARDIKLLDFSPTTIQPVDMFPHTHHIELVANLV